MANYKEEHVASIYSGHASLISDIDWNKAVEKGKSEKIIKYIVIDTVDIGRGITTKTEHINMTHLTSIQIEAKILGLKNRLGLLAIDY